METTDDDDDSRTRLLFFLFASFRCVAFFSCFSVLGVPIPVGFDVHGISSVVLAQEKCTSWARDDGFGTRRWWMI